ncbi:MAG: DUF695 domain-containing protein [Fluviicola sp.]
MTEYKVIIPKENYSLLNFTTDNLPGIAVVNSALRQFEPKAVFDWHLSIMVDLVDLIENGMPSESEVQIIDEFGDYLDNIVKGKDKEKPNALFLARITWNKTRELIWRVNNVEAANNILQKIISDNSSPREFEYHIEHDESWKLSEWHLAEWK